MCGLVRNQIVLGGSRYADVFAVRVREWMPAMRYGGQGHHSGRCVGISALNLRVVSGGLSTKLVGADPKCSVRQWSLANYYLVKAPRSTTGAS